MASADSTVEYRDIPDFPGYRVGSDGSFWSCCRQQGYGKGGGTYVVLGDNWRRLKCQRSGWYNIITLRGRTMVAHQIVLEVFVGPRPHGMEACHNDGNHTNNAVSNLRWDTHKNNMADRVTHGTLAKGERHGNAIITEATASAIRAEYAAGGVTQTELAAKYHVSQPLVSCIIRRVLWA